MLQDGTGVSVCFVVNRGWRDIGSGTEVTGIRIVLKTNTASSSLRLLIFVLELRTGQDKEN